MLNTLSANHSTQIILKSFCSQFVCLVTAAIFALSKRSHLFSFQCRTSEHKLWSSNCYQVMVKLLLWLASCNLAEVNIIQLLKSRNSLRIETNRYTPITLYSGGQRRKSIWNQPGIYSKILFLPHFSNNRLVSENRHRGSKMKELMAVSCMLRLHHAGRSLQKSLRKPMFQCANSTSALDTLI